MKTVGRREFLALGGGIAVLTTLPLAGCGGGESYPDVSRAGIGPVATTTSGRRYQAVAAKHSLTVTEPGGAQARLGTLGVARGQFNFPTGVAVLDGRVYVVETGNHRVQILDDKGNPLGFIGEGDLLYPGGVAVGKGEIYVSDSRNGRIVVFSPDGTRLRVLGQGILSAPRGLSVTAGALLVADPGLHKVLKLSLGGELLGEIDGDWFLPWDVATDGTFIYVADASREEVGVATWAGERAPSIPLDATPTNVWFSKGNIYVATL